MLLVDLDGCNVDIRTRVRKPDGRVSAQRPDFKDVFSAQHARLQHQKFALGGGDSDVGEIIRTGVTDNALKGLIGWSS